MLSPSAQQLAVLSRFERLAFSLCHRVNTQPQAKRLAHLCLREFGARGVQQVIGRLLHVQGLEPLQQLRPERGVLLIANHRSFFDLYVVSSLLLRSCAFAQKMYFPVRSTYFYERPAGLLINGLMSAFAMYPPILREPAKREFNHYSVELLAELAQQPGTVVGIHPEGRRSKEPDPYALLAAQPGVGQIAYRAMPLIIPVFVLGLSNDFVGQIRGNFDRTGEPVTVVFGRPFDLESYRREPARLRTYKKIADRLGEELMALGQKEKEFRKQMGLISKEPPVRIGISGKSRAA